MIESQKEQQKKPKSAMLTIYGCAVFLRGLYNDSSAACYCYRLSRRLSRLAWLALSSALDAHNAQVASRSSAGLLLLQQRQQQARLTTDHHRSRDCSCSRMAAAALCLLLLAESLSFYTAWPVVFLLLLKYDLLKYMLKKVLEVKRGFVNAFDRSPSVLRRLHARTCVAARRLRSVGRSVGRSVDIGQSVR